MLDQAEITQQVEQAGEIMGIEFLGHIIFNRNSYYSFLESGRLTSRWHRRRSRLELGIMLSYQLNGVFRFSLTIGCRKAFGSR